MTYFLHTNIFKDKIVVDNRVNSTLTQNLFPDLKLRYKGAMSKLEPWLSKT